jgi:hypothetical protein
MFGVYARWIVTTMTNEYTFWNWPIVEFPRNPMSSYPFKQTIAACLLTRFPFPTLVGTLYVNFFPEYSFQLSVHAPFLSTTA